MTTLFHRGAPRDMFEGGPLVATPPRKAPLAMVELDRTGAERVAKAALLMVERSGLSRSATAAKYHLAQHTIAGLIRMDTPWQVSEMLLAKIEKALGLQPGDVLAGRAPEPAGQVGKTIRRCV